MLRAEVPCEPNYALGWWSHEPTMRNCFDARFYFQTSSRWPSSSVTLCSSFVVFPPTFVVLLCRSDLTCLFMRNFMQFHVHCRTIEQVREPCGISHEAGRRPNVKISNHCESSRMRKNFSSSNAFLSSESKLWDKPQAADAREFLFLAPQPTLSNAFNNCVQLISASLLSIRCSRWYIDTWQPSTDVASRTYDLAFEPIQPISDSPFIFN